MPLLFTVDKYFLQFPTSLVKQYRIFGHKPLALKPAMVLVIVSD